MATITKPLINPEQAEEVFQKHGLTRNEAEALKVIFSGGSISQGAKAGGLKPSLVLSQINDRTTPIGKANEEMLQLAWESTRQAVRKGYREAVAFLESQERIRSTHPRLWKVSKVHRDAARCLVKLGERFGADREVA